MIHGSQGGFHVWGAFRVKDTPADHVHYIDWRLEQLDGKQLAWSPYCPDLELADVQGDWRADWGHTVRLLPKFDPYELDGTDAILRVTVDDSSAARTCARPRHRGAAPRPARG